ncbi:monovalent cation/H+ antiporter complex subunit F [Desulfurivibrio sp. D14AmB]|uniref:monovalent cation/H+ antiporter complex subunit F n=1 Tax=Desulfurivibrio sp. D14AmB TaxID=3374370 RepID=UPI00376EE38C
MTLVQQAIYLAVLPLLALALLLAFVRMLLGPSLPDRVVALETIAVTSVGMIVVYAVASDEPVLLDVASVWAIISFVSIIAFAHYIERWRRKS